MAESFSPRAEFLWFSISEEHRTLLLQNVWCGKCRAAVSIVDYTGTEERGHVILRGRCAACGGSVARLVETGERPPPPN